jgi:hypothetical protein
MTRALLCISILCLAAPAAAEIAADRFYFGAGGGAGVAPPAHAAPFPKVSLPGPLGRMRAVGGAGAAVVQTAAGDFLSLSASGEVSPTGIPAGPPEAGASFTTTRTDAHGVVVVVCRSAGCSFYACADDGTRCSAMAGSTGLNHNMGAIADMAAASGTTTDGSVWVAGEHCGLLLVSPTGAFRAVSVLGNVTAIATTSVAGPQGHLAVGTTMAVYYSLDPGSMTFLRWIQANGASMDGHPTAMTFLSGELWIGGTWCLNVLRKDGVQVDRVAGSQGLPFGNITSLGSSSDGTLWVAGPTGLATFNNAAGSPQWRYFSGDRWMPGSSNVTALAAGAGWVATPFGVARLYSVDIGLAQKAALYTNMTAALSRHGWVASVNLDKYGDTSADSIVQHDGDNDGLWTGMLVSGLIYQYAMTGSEAARALAWKHYAAVEFLHNVTETKGFIARSAVKCGEPHGRGDSGVCPHGAPNSCGWVNSSACYAGVDDDCAEACWIWKRDTSSDEVTGHFFTQLLAWKYLARTGAERDRVANTLCATADYLLQGKLRFIDPISGKGTSWGYWDPEQLNGIPGKPNERGENSLEALSFMAAAARVCKDPTKPYGKMFAALVREHGYGENVVLAMATSPQSLAFFDFRLAFMSFHVLSVALPELMLANGTGYDPLIPLTKSEQGVLRAQMMRSVVRYWSDPATGATVDGKNNFDAGMEFVYMRMTGKAVTDDPQYQLKRWPLELIQWPVRNSERWDVAFSRDWLTPPNNKQVLTRALPADEAFLWSDFLTEGATCGVDGGDGKVLQSPGPWLLVYWMQEFHKSYG